MLFKNSSFIWLSGTICAILVAAIMRNDFVKIDFEFGSVVQEEMFKHFSYLELWRPFCSAEQNH